MHRWLQILAIVAGWIASSGWGTSHCCADWQTVTIPNAWRSPPRGQGGYAWYRCLVAVPADWKGRPAELFLEPVDDAREIYLNGSLIGRVGSFPPNFRSGLGEGDRHAVPEEHFRYGADNLIAVRVYNSDGRGDFNVAVPVLFAGEEAIRLQGTWQFQVGDDRAWATWSTAMPEAGITHSTRSSKASAEKILRQIAGEGGPLTPEESLRHFKTPDDLQVDLVLSEPAIGQPLYLSFDERGRLWVMNYQQYPRPAGLTVVSRDKFLRTVFDKVPLPPPHHVRGADKITIHTDTNGDGRFDQHATFVDGLNMATSFACGRGGVWVLNPPYLLFYPDRNQDDVPDGDPEIHLEGFGLEDSHALANSLRFGPDGWLYACQGSTVTGNIRRYGYQDKPIHSLGQLIWRYHPERRRYEIFAEGGGNTFGVEIDAHGRIYSGHNGGDTRGFHYVQGGYYEKGFGKHGELSNPYAFGFFPQMPHHRIPRFTHAFLIEEGQALPPAYAGKLFGVAPLQSHVVISDIQPNGASFKTKDIGHALSTDDPWFRPVAITSGPDGAIYVADFYEQRIDHASHYQGRVDTASGRVYRVRAKDAPQAAPLDLRSMASQQLVERLRNDNRWQREVALRVLGDRRDPAVIPALEQLVANSTGQLALNALWAWHLSAGWNESMAARGLEHADPFVRLWTVRLTCDEGKVSTQLAIRLAQLAATEPNVEARCQLACSARRLPADQCLPIVKNLLGRDEDANDVFLPLLLWWAIEAQAGTERDAVVAMFGDRGLWQKPIVEKHILGRLMRRFAQAGAQKDLLACATLLELAQNESQVAALIGGFEAAFAGREMAGLPGELNTMLSKVGGGSLALRLRRSDPQAVDEALQLLTDEKTRNADRIRYLQIFGQIHQPRGVPVLLQVAKSARNDDVRSTAISSLQAYDDARIPTDMIEQLGQWPDSVREVALSVLAGRGPWATRLLEAVDQGRVPRESIPRAVLHKILLQKDPKLANLVAKHWGEIKDASTEAMQAQVASFAEMISGGVGNPYQGKRHFVANCGKCHVLFNAGGQIGPDLTAYQRNDLHRMLMNVVNPSLEIREGFENFMITTKDGRVLNGFIADQDNRVVVLRQPDGQTVIVSRDDIDELTALRRSIMPDGLLTNYTAQQLRDLFAYLRATQPLAE